MARLVKDSIRCGSVQDEGAARIEAMLFGTKRDAAMSFGGAARRCLSLGRSQQVFPGYY
jgi:hypothetical protein